jgi:hypothetical protein
MHFCIMNDLQKMLSDSVYYAVLLNSIAKWFSQETT